jgi:hypothetical protein
LDPHHDGPPQNLASPSNDPRACGADLRYTPKTSRIKKRNITSLGDNPQIPNVLNIYSKGLMYFPVSLDPRRKARTDFSRIVCCFGRQAIEEAGHHAPHLHIDYGRCNHVASYSIHNHRRLAGTLSTKYDRVVTSWISEHREKLLRIWGAMQSGDDPSHLVGELPGNA